MNVNWQFLSSWSAERAWWFGVFLGDGCAPRTGQSLQCTGSISTITRWYALVTPDPPNLYQHKHSPAAFVGVIYSKPLAAWMLSVHGYRGKKSDKLKWPEDLPAAYLAPFIRGLWDSDGCIWLQEAENRKVTGNPARSLIYTSISIPFVERLAVEIERAVGLPAPTLRLSVVPKTGNRKAQLAYTGAAAELLADWLYAEAPEHLRNEDRIESYRAMCEIRTQLAAPCPCGEPDQYTDGLCRTCHEAKQPHITGEGTICGVCNVRPVIASGKCDICRKRAKRAELRAAGVPKKVRGTCGCGSSATRKGDLCEACYTRDRRGAPLRSELQAPVGGWHSRAGVALPGRPRTDV